MKKAMKQSTLVLILNTLSIVLLVAVATSFALFYACNTQVDKANEDRFELTYNANRFMNGSASLTNDVRAYAATADKTYYDAYWAEVNELKNRDIGVANLREIGITDEEEAMIKEMSDLSNQLVPLEDQAMQKASAGQKEAALAYVYGESYSSTIARINELKADFLKTLDARSSKRVDDLKNVVSAMGWIVALSLILLVSIQVIQILVVRKRIIRPVLLIKDEMLEISRGNLSHTFELQPDTSEIGMLTGAILQTKSELTKYIDDISYHLGEMSRGNMNLTLDINYIGDFKPIQKSFQIILDSLNTTLSTIDDVASQVSANSNQVSSGAQALAQGATEQASTVQELAATVQDLTKHMVDIADNASQARSLTVQAADSLLVGDQKMQEMQQAMKDIATSSQGIDKIIKTIEDIAFQTDILALNAAVEAARAGVAGKGFAVVADEVRNLANKSSEASQQTTLLIERSTQAVERGVALAEDTARTLATVVSQTRESSTYVDSIANDSEEQATALQQISVGVDQISSVVQTNSATAEESAAASQELSQQAGQLKERVNAFQLRSRTF